MKVVALMPMKGHSERVPGKNLKLFNGVPMYQVMLEKLLACPSIHLVVINTDSQELKAQLQQYYPQVKVHDRPTELQGDFVSMNKLIAFDMQMEPADVFIQTHSTNPLLSEETLENAIGYFKEHRKEIDSVFSVTPLQTRLYWMNGKPVNHNPEELVRTQDLPVIYEENSCFFIFTADSFKTAGGKRIGRKPHMFAMSKLEAVDIDEPEDFVIAEMLHRSSSEIKREA